MEVNLFFQILILIVSVMAHEVAHGAAAYAFGDFTAKNQGRLTLNPLKHIDFFGSIILPLVLIVTRAGFIFGWAKPVPYNPYNLKNRRLGEFCVAIAGIATNFIIALFFIILIKFSAILNFTPEVVGLMIYIVFLNLVLAIFNLMPIPPLDGSKILFILIPYKYERHLFVLEKYGFFILIIFIVFFGWIIGDIINFIFNFLI